MFDKQRAFTLLELMIVVIIIGILASLAIPRFLVARDNAIMAEAKNMLGAIRGSQIRYALENNDKYSVGLDAWEGSTKLDIQPSADPPFYRTKYFIYNGADDSTASEYIAHAQGLEGTTAEGWQLRITKDGKIDRTPP